MFRKDIVLGGVCAGMFVMPQLMTARQLVTDGGDKPNIILSWPTIWDIATCHVMEINI